MPFLSLVVWAQLVASSPWLWVKGETINEFNPVADGGVSAQPWPAAGAASAKGPLLEVGDRVWVVDQDVVQVLSRAKGARVGVAKVLGASGLGALANDGPNRVYVTDVGLKRSADAGAVATGTDGLYAVEPKGSKFVVKTMVKSRRLGHPRALVVDDAGVWVASSDQPQVVRFDPGARALGESLPLPCAPRFISVLPSGAWFLGCADGAFVGALASGWERLDAGATSALHCVEGETECVALGLDGGVWPLILGAGQPAPDASL